MKENKIRETLKEVGVETHKRGYNYLYLAIYEQIKDPYKGAFVRLWYDDIAEMYQMPIKSVYDAVEDAINAATRKNKPLYEELFKKGKPSARNFISTLAEYVKTLN